MSTRYPTGGGIIETTSGGARGGFPETRWSLVCGLRAEATDEKRKALETLCRNYWKPVYAFVRRSWSRTHEDAKDLTQAFFVRLLEGETLKRFAPERGSFRTYLRVVLRGFAANQHEARNALKRGGGVSFLPLDATAFPEVAGECADVGAAFDRDWKKEVVERALERTRERLESAGRGHQFRALQAYDMSGKKDEKPTYATVAKELDVSESDVRNHLFAARECLREEIRRELTQTVDRLEDLDGEMAALFGS